MIIVEQFRFESTQSDSVHSFIDIGSITAYVFIIVTSYIDAFDWNIHDHKLYCTQAHDFEEDGNVCKLKFWITNVSSIEKQFT